MATWLKQSTAVEIKLGPFVDSGDGNTVEDGLTIEDEHVDLAKNGGDWGDKNETTTCVHESQGWYRCLLDTTDTNTLGILLVKVHVSGALPVWREFMVAPANVYDSLFSTDKLQVHVDEMTAGIITATVIADNAIDAGAIASDAITSAKIADNAITAAKIADGAIDSATFAAGAIDAAAIAADAITSVELSQTASDEIAAAILDLADGVESGITLRQAQRAQLAAAVGKLSGALDPTMIIRDANDTKNRITADIDGDGNRTAVVLDLS